MSIFETNLLEAAMKRLPYGVLCNFGNQWKYGRHLNLSGTVRLNPFIELDMGLDNIINRFRADFVRGVTGIMASRGYTQLPQNLFMVKFFADKVNVVASFISCNYYESFMQVLEALFHAFVVKNVKNGLWLRETKPLGKLCCLALYF